MPKGKPIKRIPCRHCGTVFQRNAGGQKWCSRECYLEASRAPLEPRLCVWCRESYVPRRNDQKYCGSRCRAKHRYDQKPHGSRFPVGWGIKAKGETSCRNCGRQAAHLHHIVPRSKSQEGKANVAGNGLPLCVDCHAGWHDRRITIYRDRLTVEEREFAERVAGAWWVEKNYPYRPDEELRRSYCMDKGLPLEDEWRLCREGAEGREAYETAAQGYVAGLVGIEEARRRTTHREAA